MFVGEAVEGDRGLEIAEAHLAWLGLRAVTQGWGRVRVRGTLKSV